MKTYYFCCYHSFSENSPLPSFLSTLFTKIKISILVSCVLAMRSTPPKQHKPMDAQKLSPNHPSNPPLPNLSFSTKSKPTLTEQISSPTNQPFLENKHPTLNSSNASISLEPAFSAKRNSYNYFAACSFKALLPKVVKMLQRPVPTVLLFMKQIS